LACLVGLVCGDLPMAALSGLPCLGGLVGLACLVGLPMAALSG
jgi:hypothetical protein